MTEAHLKLLEEYAIKDGELPAVDIFDLLDEIRRLQALVNSLQVNTHIGPKNS